MIKREDLVHEPDIYVHNFENFDPIRSLEKNFYHNKLNLDESD